jgi:hypothetical protein
MPNVSAAFAVMFDQDADSLMSSSLPCRSKWSARKAKRKTRRANKRTRS